MSGVRSEFTTAVVSCVLTLAAVGYGIWSYALPWYDKQVRSEYAFVQHLDEEVLIGAKLLQSSCEHEKVCDSEEAKKYITRIANIKKIYSQAVKK